MDWAWVATRGDFNLVPLAADMAEEAGQESIARALREGRLLPEFTILRKGYGAGYGYGDRAGYGYGYGAGYGDGYRYKAGYRYEYGNGYGDGYGYSEPTYESLTMDELEVGQTYMWMVGYGWIFVGKFVRREGLFGAVLDDVVNVVRTGGTSWVNLCAGHGRDQATLESWPRITKSGTPFSYAQPFAK